MKIKQECTFPPVATTLLGKVRHLLPEVVILLRFFLRELIFECSDISSSIM